MFQQFFFRASGFQLKFLKGNPNSRGILNNHTNIALLLQKATHKYQKLTDY